MANAEEARSLIRKLSEVMAAVDRIPKGGHNATFNYDFVRESDVTDAIRSELASRHVMVVPYLETTGTREMKTHSGSMTITLATYRFTFHDGESGETIEARTQGEGMDGQDKGSTKALTAALKYILLKTFLIPTGDDPDAAEATATAAAPARTRPAAAPTHARPVAAPVGPQPPPPTDMEAAAHKILGTAPSPDGGPVEPRIIAALRSALDVAKDKTAATKSIAAEVSRLGYADWHDFLARGRAHSLAILELARTFDRAAARMTVPA